MEKQIPVMKQSLELSATILEGLQHIQKLFGEGKFEETIYLFEDVVTAFFAISQSVAPLKENVNIDNLHSEAVQQTIALAVSHYERKEYRNVQEIVQFTLLPQMKKWKAGMESEFARYIIS